MLPGQCSVTCSTSTSQLAATISSRCHIIPFLSFFLSSPLASSFHRGDTILSFYPSCTGTYIDRDPSPSCISIFSFLSCFQCHIRDTFGVHASVHALRDHCSTIKLSSFKYLSPPKQSFSSRSKL